MYKFAQLYVLTLLLPLLLAVSKKGEEGYDPAYKFDYIWDTIIHNVNAVALNAELDLCGDETTYATASFGEKGSGLTGRIKGKPGVAKGGQIILVSDVHRIRSRAYVHRHKIHKDPDHDMTGMGMIEVKLVLEKLKKMISCNGEQNNQDIKTCSGTP